MSTDGTIGTGAERTFDPIDRRLARLAPTTSPDPDRLAAARAALEASVDDGGAAGTGRSSVRGGAHVIELTPHGAGDRVPPGAGDIGSAGRDVLRARPAQRPRLRDRRAALVAAAAGGIVVVAAAALLVSPAGLDLVPSSSPVESCQDRLAASAVPKELADDVTWRTLARQSSDRADLTLLTTEQGELSGFCADAHPAGGEATSTTVVWPWGPDDAPARDEILPRGTVLDGWSVLWGVAGEDVVRVDVSAWWTDEGGPGPSTSESGLEGEARMTDGYWSAFFAPGEIPDGAEVTLTWHLADGTTRSAPLDSAWEDGGEFAGARRTGCDPDWREAGTRPVVEVRREDHGVTMFVKPSKRWFRICVQDAEAPYEPLVDMGGDLPTDDPPADGVAVSSAGGSSDRAGALVGLSGEDVARVVVTTADGTTLDADLADGYWVAWATDSGRGDEGTWTGATLTWYDADGTRLGTGPALT
ncbi:hypothetical protein GCM10009809_25520 [Isoptericola hypogeus]|uniref:Uncharacterized protein n=1 Tax=Isoptericola hypogeus TaxID=300179 RepID=A0ABN2JJM7_9MICO